MSSPDNNTKHDGFTESLTHKIEKKLLKIEQNTDLSEDKKASKIIHIFSATCAAAATQPLPFADIFVLTTIQAYMAERLSAVRGVPLTKAEATTVVIDLVKVIGLGMVAQQIALGLYKVGLPFFAGFTTIPLVYGLTYGIGKTLDAMFISRAKGTTLDPGEVEEIWAAAKKEGKIKYKEAKTSERSEKSKKESINKDIEATKKCNQSSKAQTETFKSTKEFKGYSTSSKEDISIIKRSGGFKRYRGS